MLPYQNTANAIPGTTYRKIEEFQRVQVAGFFEVVNYTQAANESGVNVVQTWFPPPQIVDLKVLYANQNTGAITITWTAVGNRLDHGTGKYIYIYSFRGEGLTAYYKWPIT